MSDGEIEIDYVRPEKVVHYGSLEDAERARLTEVENNTGNDLVNSNTKLKTISSVETRTAATEGISIMCVLTVLNNYSFSKIVYFQKQFLLKSMYLLRNKQPWMN